MNARPIVYLVVDDLSAEGIGGVACTRHLVDRISPCVDLRFFRMADFAAWRRVRSQWIRAVIMNVLLAFRRFPPGSVVLVDAAYARETCLAVRVWKAWSGVNVFGIVHHFTFNVKPAGWGRRLFRECERFFTSGLQQVFVNSQSTRDQVIAFLEHPTPVHRFWVPKRRSVTAAKTKADNPEAPVRFLFVGSVDLRKGVDQAMDAVLAYEGKRRIEFRVVGRLADWGGFPSRVKELLERDHAGRISLLGHLGGEKLADEFATADAFLFPSHWEGYGMAVEEALDCGLPVITYNVGAVPELVDDSCGWLVPDGDVNGLTRAIAECAENNVLRHSKSAAARTKAARIDALREPMEKPFLEVLSHVATL